jgi:hypothetical protein
MQIIFQHNRNLFPNLKKGRYRIKRIKGTRDQKQNTMSIKIEFIVNISDER